MWVKSEVRRYLTVTKDRLSSHTAMVVINTLNQSLTRVASLSAQHVYSWHISYFLFHFLGAGGGGIISLSISLSLSLSLSVCARERERDAVIQSLVTSVLMRPGIGGTVWLKRRFF